MLKQMEEGTDEEEEEDANNDEDYYYDADVVIFDKLDPNEVRTDIHLCFPPS